MQIFRRYELIIGFLLGIVLCTIAAIYTPYYQQNHKTNSTPHSVAAKVSTDERLAEYTLWLAILTGVLALSTIALWIVTWRAGIRQSHDMQASIALARQEFISTHRPKLVVRELLMLETEGTGDPGITVRYVIANIGAGNARIVESWVEVQFSRDRRLWPLQPTDGANPIGDTLIKPGSHVFREQGSTVSMLSLSAGRQILQSGHHPVQTVFFRGFILYLDDNLVRRRTAFCRVWNWETNRFDVVNDPDYEYAD